MVGSVVVGLEVGACQVGACQVGACQGGAVCTGCGASGEGHSDAAGVAELVAAQTALILHAIRLNHGLVGRNH